MSRKRKIDKPFDFGYNVMYNEYPKELHKVLNVPGIFRRKANEKVYFKDGSIGEMDSSYIIDPDSKTIFEPRFMMRIFRNSHMLLLTSAEKNTNKSISEVPQTLLNHFSSTLVKRTLRKG